ncbi:hypothetical protein NB311A_11962 [Nitrobacter sp. Nb-311A]|uniref:hypothetical protein n=1 Tax=Nitrobacter sp. Nb-311A TaxID=314253 RepID=UPI0000685309|nr:hypothetical protein [Nitrobacter sp. Nb-311A]EAQ34456.1 hypothetical protein NB311A_11962 [Nitrobacter sp. Nb-311A]
MSDETNNTLPPLPQAFSIPATQISKWTSVPPQTQINIAITRGDMDNLFFAMSKSAQAISSLQTCLILYSQGKIEEANHVLAQSQRNNVESDNHLRMFMNAVMSGVVVVGAQ